MHFYKHFLQSKRLSRLFFALLGSCLEATDATDSLKNRSQTSVHSSLNHFLSLFFLFVYLVAFFQIATKKSSCFFSLKVKCGLAIINDVFVLLSIDWLTKIWWLSTAARLCLTSGLTAHNMWLQCLRMGTSFPPSALTSFNYNSDCLGGWLIFPQHWLIHWAIIYLNIDLQLPATSTDSFYSSLSIASCMFPGYF